MSDVVSFTAVPQRLELGEGVVVRRYDAADLPALVDAVNRSLDTLRPWMPWAQEPATVEGQRAWLVDTDRMWEAGTGFTYGIFGPAGDVLGGTGFHVRNGPGVLEIGYWLRGDQEGRGLMTRVTAELTTVAGQVPGVTRVEIHCDRANTRSAAIPQRLGYVLAREEPAEAAAPAHTGVQQVWVREVPLS